MKTQIRTNTTTLGPFLTLILMSRPKSKSANENPFKVCGSMRFFLAAIRHREKNAVETKPADVRQRMLGPFVSLILRLGEAAERRRLAAEHNWAEHALCVRIHSDMHGL